MNCERCDIKDAVFLQTLALGAALPILLYQSRIVIREHHNKKLLTFFIPSTIVGTPLGNFLQDHIPSDIVRLVVGLVITFALTNTLRKLIPNMDCWKRRRMTNNNSDGAKDDNSNIQGNNDDEESSNGEKRDLDLDSIKEGIGGNVQILSTTTGQRKDAIDVDTFTSKSLIVWGTIAGFFSGFLGGLVGIRGPPLMVFFLSFPFPKNVVRANSILILIVNISIRACYYLIEDISGTRESPWFENDVWYLYVCVMVFGVLGVPLGKFVANHTNENKFKLVIAFMLFVSGLSNIIKGGIQVAERV